MSLLELLLDFEELSKKYKVTKVEEEEDIWASSPYFIDGGVSTSSVNGFPDKTYPTYGYERYTWRDTRDDS